MYKTELSAHFGRLTTAVTQLQWPVFCLQKPQSTRTENVHGPVGPAHGRTLPRSTSGFTATAQGRITPSACSLQNAACWRKLSSSALPPQPSSVPPLPLCELFLPARVRSDQERMDGDPMDWLACNTQLVLPGALWPGLCHPRPARPPGPQRETHGHAGLALLLPLAANPLLLCPLRSPLFLQKERTLAWTPWRICILSVPRDTSLTPKSLRPPRADLLLSCLPRDRVDK